MLFWSNEVESYRDGPRGCPISVDSAQAGFAMGIDWYWTDSIDAAGRTYYDPESKEAFQVNLSLNHFSYRDSTGTWVYPDSASTSILYATSHEAIHLSGIREHRDTTFEGLDGCFGVKK